MISESDKKLLKTVGLFNDSYPPVMDGVAVCVQNYAYWIDQKGVPVTVVTPEAPLADDSEVDYTVLRYRSISMLFRRPYRLGLPDLDFSIRKKINQTNFGIVHSHCPFSSGILGAKVARERGIPLVATFHSKFRDDFEQATRSRHIAQLLVKEIIPFFENADEVWIPQAAVEDTLREYGYKGAVEVVENGNDLVSDAPIEPLKKASRKALNISDNELMLLFVGQHIWQKNTELIIRTLADVHDLPYRMFFVGVGNAANEMKELVYALNIGDKVTFVGSVTDRERLKSYYAAADLFLFPSLYDNAPLVVREAAAMHTPSIMTAGATAAEIIVDNSNGFLIENNVASFAAELRQLFANRALIAAAGNQAAATLARSWNSISDEVLDRYVQLIKRKQ